MNVILFCQERGFFFYEDQELKDYEEGEVSIVLFRDAISLVVFDEIFLGICNYVIFIFVFIMLWGI